MTRPADLAGAVHAFAARLRERHGFLCGPAETADALRALGAVNVLRRAEVRDALRAVLTGAPGERRVFDLEFNAYFRADDFQQPTLPPLLPPAGEGGPGAAQDEAPPQPQKKPGEGAPQEAPPPAGADEDSAEEGDGGSQGAPLDDAGDDAPDAESGVMLRARLSPNASGGGEVRAGGEETEAAELLRAAGAVLRAVELGRARRLRPQPRGPKLDARRTLRAAARTAGDPALLRWLGRPRRAPRFLLVLDGSRSMGKDAALLLRFAHALHLRTRRVEVYAFSTGLTRLTPHLRRALPGAPLTLPDLGEAWGGGTRIGENLLRLAREARERVDRDTLVLILSDGLDTGAPADVERALRDLKRRSGGVVWLSPLAGTPNYQPVQRAIRAALPHLWALLPAGSVADLHALARGLRRGATGRAG